MKTSCLTRETGFAEQHFGAWEKKHWNDLPKGETTRFWADFARQHPPNGEKFQRRCRTGLGQYLTG